MQSDERTIEDFGQQWNHFRENLDFYGSVELFKDAFPLIEAAEIEGKHVLDVGSGSGRIVLMLLNLGAGHVTAIEPSSCFGVLQENLIHCKPRTTCLQQKGDELTHENYFDLCVSYGVIHHIEDPIPTLKRMHRALKPGGICSIWIYGKEGNQLYLAVYSVLRPITKRMPHRLLIAFSRILGCFLSGYAALCQFLPLPLHAYMRRVISKLNFEQRVLVIYDQLKPYYAKYYTRQEAQKLFEDAGFSNIQLFHRHGYSWSIRGEKATHGDAKPVS